MVPGRNAQIRRENNPIGILNFYRSFLICPACKKVKAKFKPYDTK